MIAMSNDFKSSISNPIRQMKGYVEIEYTDSTAKDNASVSNCPQILKIGNDFLSDEAIIDDDRKGKNYASLEEDYFRLNGTFVLPNNVADKNPGIGYVSNLTFEDDQEIKFTPFQISTSFEEGATVNGLTMYFQNNNPLTLEIQVTSGTDVETFTEEDCTISSNGVVQLTFSDRVISFLRIYVTDVLYPNRRLRLQEVDFGLSAIYEGEELISFKTIEQIDRFNDSIPSNEIEVKIGDFNSSFDFKNDKGITKYLNNNVLIKPYVGVVTDGNGIEYCLKGTYWLDSYDTDSKEATLNGKDVYSKLQDKDFDKYYLVVDGRKQQPGATVSDWLKFKAEKWGVTIDDQHISGKEIYNFIDDVYSKIDTKVNNLQKMAIVGGGTFNADRYGNVVYKTLYSENVTNQTGKFISFDTMKDYPKITVDTPIKTFTVNETTVTNVTPPDEYDVLYENSFDYTGDVELYIDVEEWSDMLLPELDNCYLLTSSWSVDPTQPEGQQGYYGSIQDTYAYLKLRCVRTETNPNALSTIKIKGYNDQTNTTANTKNVDSTGSDISITNDFIATNGYSDIKKVSDAIINFNVNNRNKYSISFSYNGDPSIECGDVMYAESKYDQENYDRFIVTKIESEFAGSYSESIEGDIIE